MTPLLTSNENAITMYFFCLSIKSRQCLGRRIDKKFKKIIIRRVSQMNIQKMSKNKETQADYKLRAFIIFLFVVVVCVLKFAHVYYDRHVLQVNADPLLIAESEIAPVCAE